MKAIQRTGVKWATEYIIYGKPREDESYRHESGEGTRSGKEFVTIDSVEYFRYDCFVEFSPYGWKRVVQQ
jgi:hypothetical protein